MVKFYAHHLGDYMHRWIKDEKSLVDPSEQLYEAREELWGKRK